MVSERWGLSFASNVIIYFTGHFPKKGGGGVTLIAGICWDGLRVVLHENKNFRWKFSDRKNLSVYFIFRLFLILHEANPNNFHHFKTVGRNQKNTHYTKNRYFPTDIFRRRTQKKKKQRTSKKMTPWKMGSDPILWVRKLKSSSWSPRYVWHALILYMMMHLFLFLLIFRLYECVD